MKITDEQALIISDFLVGDQMSFIAARSGGNPEGFKGFVRVVQDKIKTKALMKLSPKMEVTNKIKVLDELRVELIELCLTFRCGAAAQILEPVLSIVKPTAEDSAKVHSSKIIT